MASNSLTRLPLLLLLLAFGACRATPLPEPVGEVHSASKVVDWSAFNLGPNDLVYFSVFGHPEFLAPEAGMRVAPDGTLSVALLGDVDVSDKSVSEARRAIEAGLSEFYANPSVTLSVIEYSSRRFFVFGDVIEPGPVPMDRPITALEALSMGGGFVSGANKEKVVIIRRHGAEDVEVIAFNAETPGPEGMVQVHPDDMLFVGRAGVGVFSDQVFPYIQGIGLTLVQISSLVLALERL